MNEYLEKLDILMKELEGKDKILEEQTSRLFNLNNVIFPDLQEYNRSCPACRERVYHRMRNWWLKNKNE
jgi:hypothetical protein